jgi:hypothetical protein
MSSVGYGDFHFGISNYGSPQYEQANCTINASGSVSASPSLVYNIGNTVVNGQSNVTGSINTIFSFASTINAVSGSTSIGSQIDQGIPLDIIQASSLTSHGLIVGQAESFIGVNSGASAIGNQIDQGISAISITSGSQQSGLQIDQGQASFNQTSNSTNIGTQIDLGSVNPIGVSQVFSIGTQVDFGASANCNAITDVLTVNPLFTRNTVNIDYHNDIFRVNGSSSTLPLNKSIFNEIKQFDSSNAGNTLSFSQCPDGYHNTSTTHLSVRSDNNSRTYLQVSGSFKGVNSGGSATNEKRTIYRNLSDSQNGSPTYTGSSWAYVYYATTPIKDDLVTATLGQKDVSGFAMLTINGYPAYQYVGDTSKETANGISISGWEAFEIDGTSQSVSPGSFVSDSSVYNTGITITGTVGSDRKLTLTPTGSTPTLFYFSLENPLKGSIVTNTDLQGVESIFLLVGGAQIDSNSALSSKGSRRYFGESQFSSVSGVSSSGELKWKDQSVANTTWTEQKQAQ